MELCVVAVVEVPKTKPAVAGLDAVFCVTAFVVD